MFFFLRKKRLKYSIVVFSLVLVLGGVFYYANESKVTDTNTEDNQLISEVTAGIELKVKLITRYIVGDDLIENKVEHVKSIAELKKLYSEWDLVEVSNSEYIFSKDIEDISPECKKGTYFSINEDGYLTLFSGDPTNKSVDNKIIETFFRIDIKKLESMLPVEPVQELYGGIPIKDRAEFNSVLSTFSEFSIEES